MKMRFETVVLLMVFLWLPAIAEAQNTGIEAKKDSLQRIKEKVVNLAKAAKRDSMAYYSEPAIAQARQINARKLQADFIYFMGIAWQLKNRDKALQYYRDAFALANKIKYHEVAANTAIKIGGILRVTGRYDSALYYNDMGRKIFTDHGLSDYQILAKYYSGLAKINESRSHHDLAIKNYVKALKIAEDNDNPELALYYHFGMAKVHIAQRDYENALKFLKITVDHAIKVNNLEMINTCIKLQGVIYSNHRKFDSALMCYRQAETFHSRTDSSQLNKLYIMFAAVFNEQHRYDSAAFYLHKSKKYIRESDLVAKANWNIFYSDLKKADNQIDSAIFYAKESLRLATILESTLIQAEVVGSLVALNVERGYYDSIVPLHEMALELNKEVYNEKKIAAIEEVTTRYETEKKEQEIAQLKNEKEIHELRDARKMLIIIFLISGIVFVIILLVLVYQKRIQRQQKQIALHQQRLLRSQINPHFIFNALTSIRGFLFDKNGQKESINYLGKFARLMRLVLDHSSREWVPLSEELHALNLYLDIQKLRFRDSFEYQINVDEKLNTSEIMVPPLLAQPFIENAVEHGFKNIDYQGKLDLECRIENETIRFSIIDNGIGVDHLKKEKKHESKALKIFVDRLNILSGLRKTKLFYLIEDLGRKGERSGTRVEYTIPIEWKYV